MRHYLKLSLLVLPMVTLMVAYQQCSGVNFKNASEQVQWSHECAEDATKCQETTEKFNSGTSNKKIDFTWIVDNSASMGNEVAIVRSNMNAFAGQLGNYTDLRMGLVSTKNSGAPNSSYQSSIQKFEMPTLPSSVLGKQVDSLVRSADALILGALALCPPSAAADSWCTKFRANKQDDALPTPRTVSSGHWNDVYNPTISQLNGFLRDQSHKVFVIVTDDDSGSEHSGHYHIKKHNFIDAYQSLFPNSMPIVYSIVSPYEDGSEPSGCSIDNRGTEYINLSNETGGKVFDICATDWTPYFNDMLAGITTLARSSFPLASVNIVDILSVKIYSANNPNNKRELAPGEYTLTNRTLTIRDDIVSGYTNFEIEVKILEYIK